MEGDFELEATDQLIWRIIVIHYHPIARSYLIYFSDKTKEYTFVFAEKPCVFISQVHYILLWVLMRQSASNDERFDSLNNM